MVIDSVVFKLEQWYITYAYTGPGDTPSPLCSKQTGCVPFLSDNLFELWTSENARHTHAHTHTHHSQSHTRTHTHTQSRTHTTRWTWENSWDNQSINWFNQLIASFAADDFFRVSNPRIYPLYSKQFFNSMKLAPCIHSPFLYKNSFEILMILYRTRIK